MARQSTTIAGLVSLWVEAEPGLQVLTFENGQGGEEIRSYEQLWSNAHRFAGALLARGMSRGDRFATLIRNHAEFVELLIAASITGCIMVPIDPRTRGGKLLYTLADAGCQGIVLADYSLEQFQEVHSQARTVAWVWLLDRGGQGNSEISLPGAAVIGTGEILAGAAKWLDWRATTSDMPLQIMFTSGTTGDPKGIVLANRRYGRAGPAYDYFGVLRPDQRPYTGLSLTHGSAQGLTLMPALAMGQRAVFSERFTKSRLWDVVKTYGCTSFTVLGGIAMALYSEPPRDDDADNPVEFVISLGMPSAIWLAFEERFGLRILEMYGATEGGNAFKPIGAGPIGSFGKPTPNLLVKIVDEDDRECPPGVAGELVSKPADGAAARVEYWNSPKESEDKTSGGWLRSGDICHQDADGWLFFHYRKGDAIRRNGDFVNRGFVERILVEHPQVSEAYVYGIPSNNGAPGDRDVVAAIAPVSRQEFSAAAVFEHLAKELEPNFVPSALQLVSSIPKTASEKPQTRFLIAGLSSDGATVFGREDGRVRRLSFSERMALIASARNAT